jgi:hypothetical protein
MLVNNEYHKSEEFLNEARRIAKDAGYDPNSLHLDDDGIHKLKYESPHGIRHFGRKGYGDYLYYRKFAPRIADQKRKVFRASHGQISRIYKLDKYSPNELALRILWPGGKI